MFVSVSKHTNICSMCARTNIYYKC